MDLNTHNRYFKNIAYNTNKLLSWAGAGAGAGEGRGVGATSWLGISRGSSSGGAGGEKGGSILPYSLSIAAELNASPASASASASAGAGAGFAADLASVSGNAPVYATAVLSVYEKRIEMLVRGWYVSYVALSVFELFLLLIPTPQ